MEGYVADVERARTFATKARAAFQSEAVWPLDTGQVHRAALRFGLVAAAGELAIRLGVLPWAPGAARTAVLAVFERWAEAFGRSAPREDQEVVRAVKAAIEAQGSRFAAFREDDGESGAAGSDRAGEARSLTTLGYRQTIGGEVRHLFHDSGWAEVTKGFDALQAARALFRAGHLEKGDGRNLKKSARPHGELVRYYTVKPSILSAETA